MQRNTIRSGITAFHKSDVIYFFGGCTAKNKDIVSIFRSLPVCGLIPYIFGWIKEYGLHCYSFLKSELDVLFWSEISEWRELRGQGLREAELVVQVLTPTLQSLVLGYRRTSVKSLMCPHRRTQPVPLTNLNCPLAPPLSGGSSAERRSVSNSGCKPTSPAINQLSYRGEHFW